MKKKLLIFLTIFVLLFSFSFAEVVEPNWDTTSPYYNDNMKQVSIQKFEEYYEAHKVDKNLEQYDDYAFIHDWTGSYDMFYILFLGDNVEVDVGGYGNTGIYHIPYECRLVVKWQDGELYTQTASYNNSNTYGFTVGNNRTAQIFHLTKDLYDEAGNLVFQNPPPYRIRRVLMEGGITAEKITKAETKEIIAIIAIILGLMVSLIALRKAFNFLLTNFRNS